LPHRLAKPAWGPDIGEAPPWSHPANSEDDDPARIYEREETGRNRSAGLTTALAGLDPRSRRIIEARWLREEQPATLQDLANEYGVSAERIRQIESKALKSMRGHLAHA